MAMLWKFAVFFIVLLATDAQFIGGYSNHGPFGMGAGNFGPLGTHPMSPSPYPSYGPNPQMGFGVRSGQLPFQNTGGIRPPFGQMGGISTGFGNQGINPRINSGMNTGMGTGFGSQGINPGFGQMGGMNGGNTGFGSQTGISPPFGQMGGMNGEFGNQGINPGLQSGNFGNMNSGIHRGRGQANLGGQEFGRKPGVLENIARAITDGISED